MPGSADPSRRHPLVARFARERPQVIPESLALIESFVTWWQRRRALAFVPARWDETDIRSYLLHLKLNDASTQDIRRTVAALKEFYRWTVELGMMDKSPFEQFDFDRPILPAQQIRRRNAQRERNPQQRELSRLKALNEMSEALNRTADTAAMLTTAVETLAQIMNLKTAWAFLWAESDLCWTRQREAPHDFELAAAVGLPDGLTGDRERFLCDPGDCRCQKLAREGRLVRAVNVVECTRLQDAAAEGGDTDQLLYHATVPLIAGDRMLGIINAATDHWEFLNATDLQVMTAAGSQIATALERAHLHDEAQQQRARLAEELEMARQVQRSLLPAELPHVPGYALAAAWQSAQEMAGDFYDVFPLDRDRWALVLADVSGKGAPAALYMAWVRSLLRSEAEKQTSPARVLRTVNTRLVTESRAGMFVTVFYAELDTSSHTLTYCNAGHDPPLVRGQDGTVERLPFGGHLLGALPDVMLSDARLDLSTGEVLVAYTDGVTDTVNSDDEDFGVERLKKQLSESPATPEELKSEILGALRAYRGAVEHPDDVTLLLLSRRAGND